MSFEMPASAGQPSRRGSSAGRRRTRKLLPTILVLLALLVLFGVFTNLYTDWLWFRSVDYVQVFTKELGTKTLLFLLFGALLGGSVAANFLVAYRTRPAFAPLSPDQQNLERYRSSIEPLRRLIVIGAALFLGVIAGSSAAGQWRTFLLWRNGVGFERTDPQFGVDVAFFAFSLPWWRFVLSFMFTTLVLSLVAATVTHYLYGGLRLQGVGERTSPAARVHLSILLGLFVLTKAVAYWLDRYSLAVKDDTLGPIGTFNGLKYTDIEALLPAKSILAIISVICAGLFFANIVRRGWLLPGIGVGLLAISAVLLGGIIPAVVQYFQVRPSEVIREAMPIERNIAATRAAYGIDKAEVTDYEGTSQVSAAALTSGASGAAGASTVPGTRLLDPAVVSPTYQQLQQIRQFYAFNEALDVDRYIVDGQLTDLVVAVREVRLPPQQQGNWINERTIYTHGFGMVAARGNARQPDGRPAFVESDIPPRGVLGNYEPRVYFGETSPAYSIVGAPMGAPDRELDYPDDTSPSGSRNNTYRGEGGVPVGSLFNQLVYAMKFQEQNILLSNSVNTDSKILYERAPRDRVRKVAPWLTLDGDPYPAVVDGRIQWIVDGYTTSSGYPYSNRTTLADATEDTVVNRAGNVARQVPERVNYIRNSVKATVDAYDGTVALYAWDDADPVLRTWRNAFPGTVRDRSEISQSLLQHLRYPQDLFKVQRELLARYHVQVPGVFYSGEDFWQVPADPTAGANAPDQPPYYLTVQMPDQPAPRFSLTTTFVPTRRQNLAAFMAVEAEPGEGYGRLRVLQLPANTTTPGPGQAYNNFESNPTVVESLNLLRRGNSEVVLGNLLTLPVGGGLLYVEPIYVRATGGTSSFPLLQRVRVAFGDRIGFADTLEQALTQVTGTAPPAGGGTSPPANGTPSPNPSPSPGGPVPGTPLGQALADAQRAVSDGEAALRRGDFAEFGAAQQRLREAIARANEAQRRAGPTSSASPSPSASGGATPSPSASASPTATGVAPAALPAPAPRASPAARG